MTQIGKRSANSNPTQRGFDVALMHRSHFSEILSERTAVSGGSATTLVYTQLLHLVTHAVSPATKGTWLGEQQAVQHDIWVRLAATCLSAPDTARLTATELRNQL
jgi:hypothetical protein